MKYIDITDLYITKYVIVTTICLSKETTIKFCDTAETHFTSIDKYIRINPIYSIDDGGQITTIFLVYNDYDNLSDRDITNIRKALKDSFYELQPTLRLFIAKNIKYTIPFDYFQLFKKPYSYIFDNYIFYQFSH